MRATSSLPSPPPSPALRRAREHVAISTAFVLVVYGSLVLGPVFGSENATSIRVGLLRTRAPVTLRCSGPYTYVALKGGKTRGVNPETSLKIQATAKGFALNGKPLSSSLLIAPTTPSTYLSVNGRSYRGVIIVRLQKKGILTVIDQLDVEDYLYGVLPKEVGVEWPVEALKAQAVVSRTFVLAHRGKYSAQGYDLSSDVSSQMYGGQSVESAATNQAVDETRGRILVDRQGHPIQAFFHSSCGGRTETPSYVWKDIPHSLDYFKSVRDSYCTGDPHYYWRAEFSENTVRRTLRRLGYPLANIRKIRIASRSPSGRGWTMAVYSSDKKILVASNRFRLALGADRLRSTLITEIHRAGNIFRFEGRGWGHGVGLCQWGAYGRAVAGQSYEKILNTYYPRTALVQSDLIPPLEKGGVGGFAGPSSSEKSP